METLMGSCLRIFPPKFGEKDRLIWRPGDVSQSRKENGFLRNQSRDLLLGFSLSVSFHCKTTVRSVSSGAQENQTLVESEETDQIQVNDQPKTVHVLFKLTKECAFGQHFVIVGDDPCFGLWDPSDGVRFDWSDGHIWTAELDVPCGKVIKYKFILKVDDNTILWQPGPDRILETWETEKTIIVFEDWDNSEFQCIVEEEEEFIADLNDEKSLINSELLTVSENLSETTQDEGTDAKKPFVGTNEHSSLDDKVKQDSNTCINYWKHEEISVLQQEAPVLLPGLIPMLTDEIDEEFPNEVKDKEDIIEEEEFIADLNDEKSLINSELLTVSESLSQKTQDEGTDAKKPFVGTNEYSSLDDKVKQDSNTCINYWKNEEISVLEQEAPVLLPGLIPMSTDETDEEFPNEVKDKEDIIEEEEFIANRNDEKSLINSELLTVSESLSQTTQDVGTDAKKQLVGTNELSSLDDDKVEQDSNTCINYQKHEEIPVLEQEASVLLPGLIPMFTDETVEESPNEVKDKELKEEHNSASLRSTETSKVVMENENGFYGKKQILDGDMRWGRVMVQKFLAVLGF